MSYVVFARKWRPKTLADVVGQETVTRTLANALTSGRIGHAFLLTGARGVGKTSTARILAAALNCSAQEGPTPKPCGACPSCTEIAAGNSVDVQEIDAASNNGVDNVRDLRESTRFNPARDRYRIWVIDEVHMLSTAAFNAFLKTLEEPPPRVKFIFATTELQKLPETILSRCQIYAFRLIPAKTLAAHLRTIADAEKIEVSDSALLRVARAAEGSVRDALSLFDQVYAFTGANIQDEDVAKLLGLIDRDLLREATRAVFENDSAGVLRVIETLASYGVDYPAFSHELLLYWRDLLVLKIAPESDGVDLLPEDRSAAAQFVAALSEEDLLRMVDSLSRSELDFRKSIDPDPRLSLEMALLKAAQLRRLVNFSDLVSRVEQFLEGSPRAVATLSAPPERPRLPASPASIPPSSPTPATAPARRITPPVEEARPVAAPAPKNAGTPEPAATESALSPMDRLREATSGRMLQAALGNASAAVDGDSLVLGVAPSQVSYLESERDTLAANALKAFGRKLRIVFKPGGQDEVDENASRTPRPARPAPTPPETRPKPETRSPAAKSPDKAALKAKVAADPLVGRTLDLFGGTLLDVRPLAPLEADAATDDEDR